MTRTNRELEDAALECARRRAALVEQHRAAREMGAPEEELRRLVNRMFEEQERQHALLAQRTQAPPDPSVRGARPRLFQLAMDVVDASVRRHYERPGIRRQAPIPRPEALDHVGNPTREGSLPIRDEVLLREAIAETDRAVEFLDELERAERAEIERDAARDAQADHEPPPGPTPATEAA